MISESEVFECEEIIKNNDANAALEMLQKLKKKNERLFSQLAGTITYMPIGIVCDLHGHALLDELPNYVNDLKIVLDKLKT